MKFNKKIISICGMGAGVLVLIGIFFFGENEGYQLIVDKVRTSESRGSTGENIRANESQGQEFPVGGGAVEIVDELTVDLGDTAYRLLFSQGLQPELASRIRDDYEVLLGNYELELNLLPSQLRDTFDVNGQQITRLYSVRQISSKGVIHPLKLRNSEYDVVSSQSFQFAYGEDEPTFIISDDMLEVYNSQLLFKDANENSFLDLDIFIERLNFLQNENFTASTAEELIFRAEGHDFNSSLDQVSLEQFKSFIAHKYANASVLDVVEYSEVFGDSGSSFYENALLAELKIIDQENQFAPNIMAIYLADRWHVWLPIIDD